MAIFPIAAGIGGSEKVTQSQRKAIGTVVTLISLVAWSALGMWVFDLWLFDAPNWVHLVFFVGFGMAWIIPAMFIIRWMARPDTN